MKKLTTKKKLILSTLSVLSATSILAIASACAPVKQNKPNTPSKLKLDTPIVANPEKQNSTNPTKRNNTKQTHPLTKIDSTKIIKNKPDQSEELAKQITSLQNQLEEYKTKNKEVLDFYQNIHKFHTPYVADAQIENLSVEDKAYVREIDTQREAAIKVLAFDILGWMFHINANEIEKEYEQLLLENGIKEYELWRKIGFSDNQIQPTTNNKAKVDEILEQIKNLRTERHNLTLELFLENDTKNPEYDPEDGNVPKQEEWWSTEPKEDDLAKKETYRNTKAEEVFQQFLVQSVLLTELSKESIAKLEKQTNLKQIAEKYQEYFTSTITKYNKVESLSNQPNTVAFLSTLFSQYKQFVNLIHQLTLIEKLLEKIEAKANTILEHINKTSDKFEDFEEVNKMLTKIYFDTTSELAKAKQGN